ncbi:MAG: MoaD/ThiS family protein [Clostridiales Family XIII bacterium]|jgi:molybdopterin converting factor small subunit|nr:MoaD/ThiS family protein [Clostridiales Family XIII bacterium]
MANVTIRYRGGIADTIGLKEERTDAPDIRSVLAYIKKAHGRSAYKTARIMIIAVNGQSILLHKCYRTELKEGDEVMFLPISGGG